LGEQKPNHYPDEIEAIRSDDTKEYNLTILAKAGRSGILIVNKINTIDVINSV
jgi:hypothetical protein